jgi:methylase of polypeptide subunit release factors
MDVYREIAGNLFQKLAPDGVGILELHSNNVDKIMEVFKGCPGPQNVITDLQGLPRVLSLENQYSID